MTRTQFFKNNSLQSLVNRNSVCVALNLMRLLSLHTHFLLHADHLCFTRSGFFIGFSAKLTILLCSSVMTAHQFNTQTQMSGKPQCYVYLKKRQNNKSDPKTGCKTVKTHNSYLIMVLASQYL